MKEKVAWGTSVELVADVDSDAVKLAIVELGDEVKSVDGVRDVDSVLLVWSVVGRSVDGVALAEVVAIEEAAEVDSAVVVEDWTVKILLLLPLLAVSEIEVVLVLVVLPQRRRTTCGDAKADPRLANITRFENIILVDTKGWYLETKCSSQLQYMCQIRASDGAS